jgi:peptidase M28-like protein
MKKLAYDLLAVACAGALAASVALTVGTRSAAGGGSRPPVSSEVRHMLRDVSPSNIEHSISALAAFGTRHTLSSQTDPNRGIGAATNWVYDQFSQYAAASNGRLTVEKQTFTQPPGPRNPNPVDVTNVIATLHGDQPESAGRTYVVSGHLDSRCTDVLDFTCDAPGADDDASGVAAVLELARVMSKHSFDATIKFVAFDGEEQGLFGSTYFANQAADAHMNIAGMFSNDIVGSSLGMNGVRDRRDAGLRAGTLGGRERDGGRDSTHHGRRERLSATPARALLARGGSGRRAEDERLDHLPAGPLPARNRRRAVPRPPLPGPPDDGAERGLPARAPERSRGERRPVRRSGAVRRLQVHRERRQGQPVGVGGARRRAGRPIGVKVEAGTLTVDTTLMWQANTEPDLAGYEIVYRDTNMPYWQHTIPVGNVPSYTVKGTTKDNYLFGVRAVDHDGNRSVVTFPVPAT